MAKNLSISPTTAHLVGPGKLKVINGRLAFTTGSGAPTRLDPNSLRLIVCHGNVGVTDDAFAMLFDHEVDVSWMTSRGGRLRGRLTRADTRSTRLRQLQHRVLAQSTARCEIARQIVVDKIQSQADAARHYQRHGTATTKDFVQRASQRCDEARAAASLPALRGIEGASTRAWFQVLSQLVRSPWKFETRVRRPPTDPVNALLSLGYTWLIQKTTARIQSEGLEVNVGALHDFRPGRPSLACDLMESLRAPVVDRWVLSLCNRNRIHTHDFESERTRGVRLSSNKFSALLLAWEERWVENRYERLLDRVLIQFSEHLTQLSGGIA